MVENTQNTQIEHILNRIKHLEDQPKNVNFVQDQQDEHDAFNALTDRVELLESELVKERNSILRKLAGYGGLAAVLISVGVGAVTLIDRFHFDRLRAIETQEAELNTIVSRLTDINLSVLELRNGENAISVAEFTQLYNGDKAALMHRAGELVEDLNEEISFPVATALAFESLNFGDVLVANRYSQIALDTAPTDGFRVNAMAHLARTYSVQGPLFDLEKARSLFDEAVGVANAMPFGTGERWALPVLTDWTIAEAYFGDCARTQELVAQAKDLIIRLPDALTVQAEYFGVLNSRLGQQNRCVVAIP